VLINLPPNINSHIRIGGGCDTNRSGWIVSIW